MKKIIQRIRKWFDWSDLFVNEFDWTQEPYEGYEGITQLYSRND
jgi:hypothetical protein